MIALKDVPIRAVPFVIFPTAAAEFRPYTGIGKEFTGGHKTVHHGIGEYAKPDGTSTNTVEGFFALLKRGITGSFHHVSRQHLDRYCNEFSFRWNYRKTTDSVRTVEAIKGVEGRRLMYRQPINNKKGPETAPL